MGLRLVLCLLLAVAPTVFAAEEEKSALGLSYVETADVKLFYFDPTLSYLAPHATRAFTNSLAWQRRVLGWVPYEPTTVLLKDFADYGNATAGVAPRNFLTFDIAPLSHAFETNSASERLYCLFNHELVHVSTMDMWSSQDRDWRRFFFGKVYPESQNPETLLYSYLTTPRFIVPRWYGEGIAVFLETWMGGGVGRAQGGYDEMVFRAMVRDGAHFYDPLGLVSKGTRIDFQVGANAYLYGTRFFTWLAYAYSPEKVVQWVRRDDASERHYADRFQQVFGLPLEKAWQDWIAFEREFQGRNLAEVRKFPVTPFKPLAPEALGSVSRAFYDETNATLYMALQYPGTVAYVGALDTRKGTMRRLTDVKGAMLFKVTSFAFDPASGTAFFTNDNKMFRDLMAVDVKTGEARMLLEDARIGDLVFNRSDRSLLGVRHLNGLSTLVRIPYPYTDFNQVHTFPYGVEMYDLDISPDGRLLSASMAEISGDQFLRVFELAKVLGGDVKPMSEHAFGQAVPESFVFSRDGRHLYGSSYYTGVSNIFRYEVANGEVEAVSNAESGFFRPIPLADGSLVVFHYTGAGFVPATLDPRPIKDVSAIKFLGAEVAARHPIVTTWQVPPPGTVDEQSLIVARGPYIPLRTMGLRNAYPVLQGYKDSFGLGYHAQIEDTLRFASLGITVAYTPDGKLASDERGHVDLKYRYIDWHAGASWNRSDFYDMFGPTKRSRKGYATNVGYEPFLVFDEPRKLQLKSDIAYYGKLDTLPDFQNVQTTVERLVTAEVGLYYTFVHKSLGAVDDEKGVNWELVASANHANGKTVPQFRGGLDLGLALPLPNSSVWLRSAGGYSRGDRNDPFATFYFGGFGNNYVDSRSIKRYREYYSFPGFELNQIGGRTFGRETVEWNVPPIAFESVGTPGFYLTWLRPAVFASALWTDPERSESRKRYASAGLQLDLRFTILHWWEMTLSAGYAVGFQGSKRSGDEWMVSLKIL